VCQDCEKKLAPVICPDVVKDGTEKIERDYAAPAVALAAAAGSSSSSSTATAASSASSSSAPQSEQKSSNSRRVGQNMLLLRKARTKTARVVPYAQKCKICKSKVHQAGGHYCNNCAYRKGICAMCGKKVLDVKSYRQSTV